MNHVISQLFYLTHNQKFYLQKFNEAQNRKKCHTGNQDQIDNVKICPSFVEMSNDPPLETSAFVKN